MSSTSELKDAVNITTTNMVLLSIATAGIYPILWMYRNCSIIERVTKKKITDDTYIIWIAVCVGLGGAFSGNEEEALLILSGLLTIASSVLYIVWAFKAKDALSEYALTEHKIDIKMNGLNTFFLNIFYINYCINDLPEMQRKQQILSGT